uniref:Ig-like domain-containing protein n=1 Tax=Lates calcarifer TaxID=8187 RepID=A0A4W6DAN4_LATCA
VVTQTPGVVVAEGATAHITCCWTGEFKKTRVNWLKNHTEMSVSSNTACQGSLQKEQCNCATLTFSRITREDSGHYICKVSVEVPVYVSARGNGTVITVMARENTDDTPPSYFLIICFHHH